MLPIAGEQPEKIKAFIRLIKLLLFTLTAKI